MGAALVRGVISVDTMELYRMIAIPKGTTEAGWAVMLARGCRRRSGMTSQWPRTGRLSSRRGSQPQLGGVGAHVEPRCKQVRVPPSSTRDRLANHDIR